MVGERAEALKELLTVLAVKNWEELRCLRGTVVSSEQDVENLT